MVKKYKCGKFVFIFVFFLVLVLSAGAFLIPHEKRASGADYITVYCAENYNDLFKAFGNTVGTVDLSKQTGDDKGLILRHGVTQNGFTAFRSTYLTTGRADLSFYLDDYTHFKSTDGESLGTEIHFFFQSADGRRLYELAVIQLYSGGENKALVSVYYHNDDTVDGLRKTETIINAVEIGSYKDFVRNKRELSLAFDPVGESMTLSLKGKALVTAELLDGGSYPFDPYLYSTLIFINYGAITVTKVNGLSLANAWEESQSMRRLLTVISQDGYLVNTGDGIIPEKVEVGDALKIHSTALCCSFFISYGAGEALSYTVKLYKDGVLLDTPVDGNGYYAYTFTESGNYTAVISGTVMGGTYSFTEEYPITCVNQNS